MFFLNYLHLVTEIPSWLTPWALNFYVGEIEQQSHSVEFATRELDHFLRGGHEDTVPRTFAAAQSLLTAAAAMSRLLWTPSKKASSKNRSALLRAELEVDESSVLHDRAVRDGFEHFDERLDHFFASGRTNLVDLALGRRELFDFGPFDPDDPSTGGAVSRLVDTVALTVAVFDAEVSIQSVYDESVAVGRRATEHRAAFRGTFAGRAALE